MIQFFHHLFNPHCPHCRDEMREEMHCESCDTRQEEIVRLRAENDRLLNIIINRTEPPHEINEPHQELKPILNRAMPFRVKRQMLEQEDRAAKRILDERIKELEKDIYEIPAEELTAKIGTTTTGVETTDTPQVVNE